MSEGVGRCAPPDRILVIHPGVQHWPAGAPVRSSCALPCPTLQPARDDQSKVHKAREAEAAKRDVISGETGVTGSAKFLDTMHKESFASDATSSVEDRLARNRYWCPKHSPVCYSLPPHSLISRVGPRARVLTLRFVVVCPRYLSPCAQALLPADEGFARGQFLQEVTCFEVCWAWEFPL